MDVTGYLHPAYAEALAEFGTPMRLPRAGGSILKRPIPGSCRFDAMGPYPLFACQDWQALWADLQELEGQLVSLAVVTDPFGEYDAARLEATFVDVVKPFKRHHVVDLRQAPEEFVHPHHRRNARKALAAVHVEPCSDPLACFDDWAALYDSLISRHGITGLAAFSRESFARQLALPGMVALRAVHGGETVGMLLWLTQGDVAYYHLGAFNERGYEVGASFALFWFALHHFASTGLVWLELGAGAGLAESAADGLSRFKNGWANETRLAYFCGKIFDHAAYEAILRSRGVEGGEYFPAYRAGEFR